MSCNSRTCGYCLVFAVMQYNAYIRCGVVMHFLQSRKLWHFLHSQYRSLAISLVIWYLHAASSPFRTGRSCSENRARASFRVQPMGISLPVDAVFCPCTTEDLTWYTSPTDAATAKSICGLSKRRHCLIISRAKSVRYFIDVASLLSFTLFTRSPETKRETKKNTGTR